MTTAAAGETPERATANQAESGQHKSEQTKSELVSPEERSWAYLVHLGALLLLLIIAIGATCEISSRNEDYARVLSYHKWLLACLQKTVSDAGCPKNEVPDVQNQAQSADKASEQASGTELAKADRAKGGGSEAVQSKNQPKETEPKMKWTGELNAALAIATSQVRKYDSLNSIGTGTKCMTAAVIASPETGFFEACVAFVKQQQVSSREHEVLLQSIVYPSILSFNHSPISLDQRPKDELYFILVLVSAAIGSLLSGLWTAGFTTHRDIILGLGAGFAVYLLVRSGNFVFLATPAANIDILNPYSAAAVGLLAGLFSGRAFKAISGMVGDQQSSASK